MSNDPWHHPEIRGLIARALAEDLGPGDVTTEACVPADAQADGFFLTREPLVLAGLPLLEIIYDQEDLNILYTDGKRLEAEVNADGTLGEVEDETAEEREDDD